MNFAGTTGPEATENWQQWRRQTDEDLKAPFGWLTLSALTWLEQTPHPIADFPGNWSYRDGAVEGDFSKVDGVEVVQSAEADSDTEPPLADAPRTAQFSPADAPLFQYQQARAEVAKRGEGVCVRIRHADSDLRRSFTGVPAWDWDEKWVVKARFEPYPQVVVRDIFTAWEGLINTMEFCGDVVFTLGQSQLRWAVSGASTENARVIFSDAAGKDDASPWRTAPVVFDSDEDGANSCVIDFNYAQNFPAHYSAWATCPRPVAENHTEERIEAGQQRPRETESHWL